MKPKTCQARTAADIKNHLDNKVEYHRFCSTYPSEFLEECYAVQDEWENTS